MSDIGLSLLLATTPALPGSDAGASAPSQGNTAGGFDLALTGMVFNFNAALSQAQQDVQQNAMPSAPAPQNNVPQNNNDNSASAPQPNTQAGQNNSQQNSGDAEASDSSSNGSQSTNTQDAQQQSSGNSQNNNSTQHTRQPASGADASGTQGTQGNSSQDGSGKKSSQLDELNALLAKALLLLQGLAAAQTASATPASAVPSATAGDTGTAAAGSGTGSTQDPVAELMNLLAQIMQSAETGTTALAQTGTPSADGTSADAQVPGSNNAFAQLMQLLQGGGAQPLSANDLQQLAAMLNGAAQAGAGMTDANATAALTQNMQPLTDTAGAATPSSQAATTSTTASSLLDALKQFFGQLAHQQAGANTTQPTGPATDTGNTQNTAQNTTGANAVLAAFDLSGGSTSGQGGNTGGNAAGHGFITLASATPLQAPGAAGATQNTSAFSQLVNDLQNVEQASSPADQVVAYVRAVAAGGDSRIQVQLHPADLGSLDIKLSVTSDGHANLSLTADNSKTLDMLRSDAKQLTQMLTNIGLKADAGSLSFNLRGDQQQPGGQGQQQPGQAYVSYGTSAPDPLDEALSQAPVQSYTVTPADGVNIVT